MATSRSKKSSRSKREPLDWVVNEDSYGASYSLPNASALAFALTLPKFWGSYIDPGLGIARGLYEFPEQKNGQVLRAVRGHFSTLPSTWALGNAFAIMARIVIKPIQYDTAGVPLVIEDPQYNLLEAQFANEQFLWQKYISQRYDMGGAPEVHMVNWSGRRMLKEDEAAWLYLQNFSGVTMTISGRLFLRSLMRADGA